MTNSESDPTRIAILGGSGIGRVHARILREQGAEIRAILGSTPESAAAAAADLGGGVKAFHELDRLLAEPLDGVSICTPPQLHHAQLLTIFDHGLAAFCEKPLFWEDGATVSSLGRELDVLLAHPRRRLFVNTSNAAFLDAVRDRLDPGPSVERFEFEFYTRGPHRGRAIAVDLLPHALSLLLRLLGRRPVDSLVQSSSEGAHHCRFDYGACRVHFDLRENLEGPKRLAFRVNEREFLRVQAGAGATYRVSLHDATTGVSVPVEDPFAIYIADFLRYCRGPAAGSSDHGVEAGENLRLMAQLLLPQT